MSIIHKPGKIFFGWWIVAAAFFISLYVGGVVFYGFTTLFEPIADEFGWSYLQISLAASLRGLEAGILAPVAGIMADRWGPRKVIFSGGIITALGILLLSNTNSLAMFYGSFVLIAIGISATIQTVLMAALAQWFKRRVGLASGIVMSGFGFGGLLIPIMVKLIDLYDWRTTLAILAMGTLIIVLPLSMLIRHKPEPYGYLPDGEAIKPETSVSASSAAAAVEAGITKKQALRSRAFWQLAFAFTCHILITSAVVAHIMPYFSTLGMRRSLSGLVATIVSLISIIGRLGFGWLGDKFNRRIVAAVSFAMMGLGLLFFTYAADKGLWLLIPFILIYGIGYGGNSTNRPSLGRDIFGRKNFGAIFGLIISINYLGSITGPPLAGWIFDNWNNYQGAWLILTGVAVVGVVSMITLPRAISENQ